MRIGQGKDSEGGLLGRISLGQWCMLIGSVAALVYCGFAVAGMVRERRALATTRMRPPAEILEARRQRGSPFAAGMTKEERRKAFENYGRDFWKRTSLQQKLEVMRGYYPKLIDALKLTAEQQGPVNQVCDATAKAMIPLWDGWWEPNFNRKTALLRSWLVAAQARQQLEPILTAEQKLKLDGMMGEIRERSERDSRVATGQTPAPSPTPTPTPTSTPTP